MTVTIYHDPACGMPRNVLGLIRNSGEEPNVIEYLKTPPTREEQADLIRQMGSRSATCCPARACPKTSLGSTTRPSPTTNCSTP